MIHVCQRVHKRTRRKAGGHRGVERREKNERKGRKFGGSSRRIWPVLYPSPSTSPPVSGILLTLRGIPVESRREGREYSKNQMIKWSKAGNPSAAEGYAK